MSETRANVAAKKIEAIKDEFHEWNEIFIQPGFSINDLMTRDECTRAIAQLTNEIKAINDQIAAARLDHAKGRKQLDGDWVFRAGKAIRHKRSLITAVRSKMESIPRSEKRDQMRQVILDVIRDDIGEDRMQAYVAEARRRFTPVDKSNNGENDG